VCLELSGVDPVAQGVAVDVDELGASTTPRYPGRERRTSIVFILLNTQRMPAIPNIVMIFVKYPIDVRCGDAD
jgi:hypothetical protein